MRLLALIAVLVTLSGCELMGRASHGGGDDDDGWDSHGPPRWFHDHGYHAWQARDNPVKGDK